MPLNGYDNVVETGLVAAGLVEVDGSKVEGTSITIEAMSKGITPRLVTLKGRGMPYRKVEWPVTQNVNTIWYPGNPIATQQVLGPQYGPTTFNGAWKAPYLNDAVIVDGESINNDPSAVVELFKSMCTVGSVWRVTWHSEVRQGVITEFKPTWIRQSDVEWSLTFDWNSTGQAASAEIEVIDPRATSTDLLGEINEFLDRVAVAPLVARQLVAMVVNDIRAIQETISSAIDILASVESVVAAPAQVIGALKAAVSKLARQISVATRRIASSTQASATAVASLSQIDSPVRQRTAAQTLVAGTSGYNPPSGIPSETTDKLANGAVDPTVNGFGANSQGARSTSALAGQLEFESWRRDLALRMQRMLFMLQSATSLMERRNVPNALKVVTVSSGETLYSISVREFGSPDYANWIAAANNLNSAVVEPGATLRIPARPTGSSSEAAIGSGAQISPTGTEL